MTAPLYRVWAKFEPHHINPLTGRRGQWRVVECWPVSERLWARWISVDKDAIGLTAIRRFRAGTIIRPHKELNRVLAAREQQGEL